MLVHSGCEMRIHSILACSENLGIGIDGRLPWSLRSEMRYFAKLSTGNPPEGRQNVILMGRNTWQSIPAKRRPLKNRWNIVLSRTMKEPIGGMHAVVCSLNQLSKLLDEEEWKNKVNDTFCIGGAQVYKAIQESPYVDLLFITRIHKEFKCDTFFEEINKENFQLLEETPSKFEPIVPKDKTEEDGVAWDVEIYKKLS